MSNQPSSNQKTSIVIDHVDSMMKRSFLRVMTLVKDCSWNTRFIVFRFRLFQCSFCYFFFTIYPESNFRYARCLKITEKVSFNIASEASYVYILSGQKLIKNAKNGPICASFWKPEACGQTVLPDRSLLIGQKLAENAKIREKFKCDILSNFQTICTGCPSKFLIDTLY